MDQRHHHAPWWITGLPATGDSDSIAPYFPHCVQSPWRRRGACSSLEVYLMRRMELRGAAAAAVPLNWLALVYELYSCGLPTPCHPVSQSVRQVMVLILANWSCRRDYNSWRLDCYVPWDAHQSLLLARGSRVIYIFIGARRRSHRECNGTDICSPNGHF